MYCIKIFQCIAPFRTVRHRQRRRQCRVFMGDGERFGFLHRNSSWGLGGVARIAPVQPAHHGRQMGLRRHVALLHHLRRGAYDSFRGYWAQCCTRVAGQPLAARGRRGWENGERAIVRNLHVLEDKIIDPEIGVGGEKGLQCFSIAQQQAADIKQFCDMFRDKFGCLGDDQPAHAVSNQDHRFTGLQHRLRDQSGVGTEVFRLNCCEIGRCDRMPRRLQQRGNS